MSRGALETTPLPREDTLLACWRALAAAAPGARLIRAHAAVAAVFPAWAPLNNAIAVRGQEHGMPAPRVSELRSLYADAGVGSWALWVPSDATNWDAPDLLRVDGMDRDTT